jgi:hypothetical protein
MSTTDLVSALIASLQTGYPTRLAELGNRPGRTTCVVTPTGAEYDAEALCDPTPMLLTVEVAVLAASAAGAPSIAELLAHVDPVAMLIRASGFEPVSWTAADVADLPAITFTATAPGHG